jgi:hypothetical protein
MIFILSEDKFFERRGREGYAEDAEKKKDKKREGHKS